MEDVLEVYQRPRDPERPVVCLDETSKQLILETRAAVPAKPGRKARHDYEYERNGVANLFMLFAPLEGWRRVKVTDRHAAVDYAHVLKDLSDVHFPGASPSVPMMVRHRSPESLASHGRRTTITWSCKTKKLKRTVPPGLVRREAGGRPQCRPRRRRRPNCRIGRGVGLLRFRRSCVFWQRLTPPPTLVGSEQSCAEKACTHRS